MATVISYEEANANQVRVEGDGTGTKGGVTQTLFLGSSDRPDLPQAAISHRDPARVSYPHYHLRDQFQVVMDGKGTLGRKPLEPYSVHFARAYTPYGPLASDAHTRFSAFVLRPHYDPGSEHFPEAQEKLKRITDRHPWQIVRRVTFPEKDIHTEKPDIALQAIPDIKDEQGLAAYTLSMQPNTIGYAPDPAHGDGQYLIVVGGSLLHQDKEFGKWSLVYVSPKDSAFQVNAGAAGLQALVLNFPRPRVQAVEISRTGKSSSARKRWQCELCAFVYDEVAGIPEDGIAPGTRWQDVPETWSCPDCAASKADFQMVELTD